MELQTKLNRSTRIAAFLFGLLPYVCTVKLPPVPTFWAEWIAALLAVLLLITLNRIGNQQQRLKPLVLPLSAISMLLMIAIVVGQQLLLGSGQIHHSFLTISMLALAATLCISVARVGHLYPSSDFLGCWAFGLLVGLVLNFCAAILEHNGLQLNLLTVIPSDRLGRATGLFGQPNHLASFAVMGWCAGHYLWLRKKVSAIVFLGVALIVGLVIAGAASRTGTIVWLGAAALGWLVLRHQPNAKQCHCIYAAAIGLFLFAHVFWYGSTGTSFEGSVIRGESVRLELLRDSLSLIELHPWAGVGFGNFASARWLELSTPLTELYAKHSHNIVIQLAVELGLPGAAAVIVPMAFVFCLSTYKALRVGATAEDFFVAGVLIVLFSHSLTEYPLWYGYFLLPFAFLMGIPAQPDTTVRGSSAMTSPTFALGASIISLMLLALVAFDYVRIQRLYTIATERAKVLKGSLNTLGIPQREAMEIFRFTAFDDHAELMASRTFDMNGQLLEKVEITRRVMLATPNTETIARHILFLVVTDNPQEALATLNRTHRNSKLHKETLAALAWYSELNVPMKIFLSRL